MIQLTSQSIRLHARGKNKEDAMRQAGRVLIDAGNIDAGYVESMLGREQQANTFLGNGIAIPYGMGKDRELIHKTGVCVVQFPDGVEWNAGQTVRIVVGIAGLTPARSGGLWPPVGRRRCGAAARCEDNRGRTAAGRWIACAPGDESRRCRQRLRRGDSRGLQRQDRQRQGDGGDKVVPYLPQPHEDNPFLGVRGIRLCLRKPELFLPQLRAICRASLTGPVKIMFPMIATLEDLRAAKEIAEQVRAELGVPPVEIGIMVEVPSTVVMAAEFAMECDFFSIGTNDLTQYTLAMDRMHPALAKQVDGLHPAVLRMIDQTVRAADAAGKWVGVCGGVAGDPRGAVILTGLGVHELSMSIPSIAAVKAHLRGISHAKANVFAKQALACATADEVRELPLP